MFDILDPNFDVYSVAISGLKSFPYLYSKIDPFDE